MIEEAVRARLLATPAVTALAGTRIMAQPLKQGLPFGPPDPVAAISYLIASLVEQTRTVDKGESLATARVQIDCWAKTKPEATALEAAVAGVLNGKRADVGLTASDVVEITSFRRNRLDRYEDDTKLFRVIADYFVTAEAA